MKLPLSFLVLASLLVTPLRAELRTFTSAAGSSIRGELVGVKSDVVTIRKEDGQTLTVPLKALSQADQTWLQTQTTGTTEPAKATKDQPFTNSLGMAFVPVPGSHVLMCIHETRRKDYAASTFGNSKINMAWKNPQMKGHPISSEDRSPVVSVSWNDARAFCSWLSTKEGRTYRLPTDREWSQAVGIGDREVAGASPSALDLKITGQYPWGTSSTIPKGAGNYYDVTNRKVFHVKPYDDSPIDESYDDGFMMTAPVMSFTPNNLGIYDLGGNVWELVEDLYATTGSDITFRGSSYADNSMKSALSSRRVHLPKDARPEHGGFRIVLEVP